MALAKEVNVLEILKRAKSGGEIVSWKEDVRDEAISRGVKAGHIVNNGTRIMSQGIGKSKLNIWPRDENGQLIGD